MTQLLRQPSKRQRHEGLAEALLNKHKHRGISWITKGRFARKTAHFAEE
jgi:hypothetical protein